MEVLGDDERDAGLTRRDRARAAREPLAELDLGSTDTDGIEVQQEPALDARPSLLRSAWAAATAGEALAACGLAVGAVTLIGGYGGPVMIMMISDSTTGPRQQLFRYSVSLAVGAAVTLLLCLVGLRQLRRDAPRWARTAAGAGIVLAVLIACVAALSFWHSQNLPDTYNPSSLG